jgi:hypothetical protein
MPTVITVTYPLTSLVLCVVFMWIYLPVKNKAWTISKYSMAQSTYFTVRGQYFSRLPKYWPPIPLSARRVCTPRLCCGGRTDSPGGEGEGGSIFWKTREIGLPSYSKICTLCSMGSKHGEECLTSFVVCRNKQQHCDYNNCHNEITLLGLRLQ